MEEAVSPKHTDGLAVHAIVIGSVVVIGKRPGGRSVDELRDAVGREEALGMTNGWGCRCG